MKDVILQKLFDLKRLTGIRILYAIESGSRVWGFHSPNSDYDVRFIYVRPPEWYLRLDEGSDTLHYSSEDKVLDFEGWDLRKALKLYRKANPAIMEWLVSPTAYFTPANFASGPIARMQAQMGVYFNPRRAIFHYLHMAKNNYEKYLREGDEVIIKKYFYVLRPILTCEAIAQTNREAPLDFDELRARSKTLTPQVNAAIDELLYQKRHGQELGMAPRLNFLNVWLEERMKYYERYAPTAPTKEPPLGELDNIFFAEALGDVLNR